MTETALKCSSCKTYRPIGWFDKEGGEDGQQCYYSSCFVCRKKWREWRSNERTKSKIADSSAIPEGHKYCPRCQSGRGAILPFARFGTNNRRKDEYEDRCRACQNRLNAKRRATRAKSHGVVNPSLKEAARLTPQVVAERLAAGLIPDQYAGYWMKPTSDDRPPCWKEVRDYTNAWNRIFAKTEVTTEAACPDTVALTTKA